MNLFYLYIAIQVTIIILPVFVFALCILAPIASMTISSLNGLLIIHRFAVIFNKKKLEKNLTSRLVRGSYCHLKLVEVTTRTNFSGHKMHSYPIEYFITSLRNLHNNDNHYPNLANG